MLLRDQKLYLDGLELASHANSVAIDQSVEVVEQTTFGNKSRVKAPGLKDVAVGVQGYFDATLDAAINNKINVADAPFMAANNNVHGEVAYFFKVNTGQYTTDGAVGDALSISLSAEGTGDLVRGFVALADATLDATAAGQALNLGAVPEGKKLVACVQVIGVADPADTVQVVIEGDAADDFSGDETQHITFDALSANGAQFVELQGPLTDTWFRALADVAGVSPSFNVIVTIGIV